MVERPPPARPGAADVPMAAHPVLMFATVALALLMSSLDQTIVATALHSLQQGLHAPITWAGWTITAYSLGLVLMLSLAGKLSEQYGRRRVFLASVIVFTGASLCCGLAGNIYVLVGLRFLQALGGAGFTPSATGIIVDHFGSSRDKAVGLFGSIFPIGAMIGPIFGGLFVDYWSWRGIFFVNVPIGALLVVFCLRYIPRDAARSSRRSRDVDVAGMSLLGAGVLGVMLALNALGEGVQAVRSPVFLASGTVGVTALVWFARHIARSPHPFIPPRFITGPGFGPVNVINVVYGGLVAGLVALIPLYATTRYGISALGSGTLLTAQGAAVIVCSTLAAVGLRRTGYRRPIYVGAAIIALGVFALSMSPRGIPAYGWLAVSGCLIGIGMGISSPASRNAGLQLAPERSSSLAALRSMGRQIGSITAISVITAVIAQAADPGAAQAHLYFAGAILLLLITPMISRIAEHRGSW